MTWRTSPNAVRFNKRLELPGSEGGDDFVRSEVAARSKGHSVRILRDRTAPRERWLGPRLGQLQRSKIDEA